MKELLRRVMPASLKRWVKDQVLHDQPLPSWTYGEDGLCTMHVADFLNDPQFQKAYAAGKATGSWPNGDLRWRVYVALWAARQAWNLSGDFVECGVHLGGLATAILTDVNWQQSPSRHFYLLDTFNGFPADQRGVAAEVHRNDYLDDVWPQVQGHFSKFPAVKLIRGAIPQTLTHVTSQQVAYLSIDMNCAEPEVAALEYFWPRMVTGGIVLLDDYAFAEAYRRQKEAIDRWAKPLSLPILSLPTGQGLLIKA
ncbi:MAG TPA: TylF/MycF/NovP-related O-methyltransferase [Gemmatales bacterium]|nr:TylF/MycF/NovP-related O-methyltransferase [Gemmatales bacterium]